MGLDVLTADVDERLLAPDGARGDQHAFDERVRVALEQVAVFEGPGLALVGVDHEVDRAGVVLRHERPFQPGGESGAAEAPKVRLLRLVGDRRRLHRPGLLPGGVTAGLAIHGQRVSVGPVEVPSQDLFRHWSLTRIRSTFSDRKSTRLNSSHITISYAVFCLKKKKKKQKKQQKNQ